MKKEAYMNHLYRLSNVTKDYLTTFYCILEKMIEGMTTAELSDNISYNFMVQMIPHHEAAIKMSENILKYTTNIPLQEIATQIITEQTKSIENMQQILTGCKQVCNTKQDLCLYERHVNQIMQTMFHAMEHACSNNQVNTNFMREMIPHHKGAVKLSETTLQYPICDELVPILDAIIRSQKRGIWQMQQLLCCITDY